MKRDVVGADWFYCLQFLSDHVLYSHLSKKEYYKFSFRD